MNNQSLNSKTQSKLKDFANLILKFQQAKDSYTLKEFVTLVIEKSGYLAELQAKAATDPEFQDDINNLQELVNVAEEFVPEEEDNILGECNQLICFLSHTSKTLHNAVQYAEEGHKVITVFYLD